MSLPDSLPGVSVRRPVLVLVVNLLIVLAGIAAMLAVEVRELPDVDRPFVTVRVSYPGASPETMDAEVISLLEGAVARVSGINNIRSASEENSGRMAQIAAVLRTYGQNRVRQGNGTRLQREFTAELGAIADQPQI